jgi:hypothetical protein
MSRSRPGFTIAEWMAIVAVVALILARGTWVLQYKGSGELAGEGVLWLAMAGTALTWVHLRPIRVEKNEGTRSPGPSSHTPSKDTAPRPRKG